VRTSHLADKWQHDAKHILETAGSGSYKVALVIGGGKHLGSPGLAEFLQTRSLEGS
jgi:hypothetical protein